MSGKIHLVEVPLLRMSKYGDPLEIGKDQGHNFTRTTTLEREQMEIEQLLNEEGPRSVWIYMWIK